MSNRKLTKFPVIAEDGTEYRVSISEKHDEWDGRHAICRLYVRRKRFGFRKLATYIYRHSRGTYNAYNPDFIELARVFYEDYRDNTLEKRLAELERRSQAQRKSAAIDAFQAWDGRL